MSKSRRKAAGCTRGRYKRKPMGKGWLIARRVPKPIKPLVRNDGETAASEDKAAGDEQASAVQ